MVRESTKTEVCGHPPYFYDVPKLRDCNVQDRAGLADVMYIAGTSGLKKCRRSLEAVLWILSLQNLEQPRSHCQGKP